MSTFADRPSTLPPFVPVSLRVRSNFPPGASGLWCELFSASGECYAAGWQGNKQPDLPTLTRYLQTHPDSFQLQS